MLRPDRMKEIAERDSDKLDAQMVIARRAALELNRQGIPASVGRDGKSPVIRVRCQLCQEWFTPLFGLPGTFICVECYWSGDE